MKVRMLKTLADVIGHPQRNRTESERYDGVQTFMWMTEDHIVEVPFDKEHLLEVILDPSNLNRAYKSVMRNKGLWRYRRNVMRASAFMASGQ